MSTHGSHSVEEKDMPVKYEKDTVPSDFSDAPHDPARIAAEKRLVRKVDARMSILLLIYIMNYLDRNNMAAARLRGFEEDLQLKGAEYPTALSILYVGYILMQIPSNMMMQRMGRPSLYLPTFMLLWGLVSTLTGVITNFAGAVACRFFLGFVEAAFFPGAMFLLSRWYTKNELGKRTAILFCGSLISNAFGPLIAAGILGKMEGALNIRAWRWLFYVEGAITMAIAIITIFILPDYPENSRGFSQAERDLAVLRITEDCKESDQVEEKLWPALKSVLVDFRVWNLALCLTALTCSLTFNQFFPTLTQSLGYNRTISLLLAAPPFFIATILAYLNGWHSDKVQERYYHIVGPQAVGIIGFIIAMTTRTVPPRYIALFLMTSMYASFVIVLTWISTSFPRPALKRSIAIAVVVSFSQLGNVAGAYVFPSKYGPTYQISYGICIGCSSASVICATLHRMFLQRQNAELAKLEASDVVGLNEADAAMKIAGSRGFRYCL